MINWTHTGPLIIAAALAGSGCKDRSPNPRPAEFVELFQRNIEHPRSAMEIAEAIKCRQVNEQLSRGPSPRRPSNRAPLPPLESDEAIVSLFEHHGDLYRFVARQDQVVALKPLPRPRLERSLVKTRDELEHASPASMKKLRPLLTQLHDQLLSGASTHLRGARRLLILPHGLSKTLPFHALIQDDESSPRGWRYLAERYLISYAPCLAQGTRAPMPLRREIVFAPAYGPNRRPAPGAMKEAALIASRFPEAVVLNGSSATPARFHSEIARPGTLVHYSGHGLADLAPRTAPELVFAARGSTDEEGLAVTIESVSRRRIKASLVVLAACTTAYAARFRDGKRAVADPSLVEALLVAGAPAAVAASWTVKGDQSARQMQVFYEHVVQEGPAAALTRAYRRSISSIRPPHPRYWAFYATYGGWRWPRRGQSTGRNQLPVP